MSIKKHVGKIKSTDQRCVVVFMQLPDDPNKALIINVEALPPRYEQMLLEVVDSNEGQQEKDLANAMARRMVPETGHTVLQEFHGRGLMRAEPVDNIVMFPRPNTPFPLRDIITQLASLETTGDITEDFSKFNPVTENIKAGNMEEQMQMAHNILMEAEMLQVEADKKREAAYAIAPSLRPAHAKPDTLDITPVKRGPGRPSKAELAARAAANGNG